MTNETFWKDLERAYADEDNRHFDNEQLDRKFRRQQRIRVVVLSVCILASVAGAFYVFGVTLLSAMPQ